MYGRRVAHEGATDAIYRLDGSGPIISRIQEARRRHRSEKRIQNGESVVVHRNPRASSKYNAHINVEVCSTVSAVNYLYQYVYKGPGRSAVEIGNGEIALYLEGRYFSAQGDFWRLLDFDHHGRFP